MKENEFWIRALGIVSTVFIGLVVIGGGCSAHESRLISQAIKDGTNPIAASCAIRGIGNSAKAVLCAAVVDAK